MIGEPILVQIPSIVIVELGIVAGAVPNSDGSGNSVTGDFKVFVVRAILSNDKLVANKVFDVAAGSIKQFCKGFSVFTPDGIP